MVPVERRSRNRRLAVSASSQTHRDARIGLGLETLAGWSPISITSGRWPRCRTVRPTSLGSQHGLNFLFVAEQHDTAVWPDRISHDGSLDSRFGSEIAPHGIHTLFYHTRTRFGDILSRFRTTRIPATAPSGAERNLHKLKKSTPAGMHSFERRSRRPFSMASFPR